MVVELRTLRITSDFDAGRYVAGMGQKVDADKAGAQSSNAVGAAIDGVKIKLSSSVPLIERLSRTYIDGYGSAAKFNGELLKLARSQDTNATSVEHLELIYGGLHKKFGLIADATELASKGYGRLASAIENVNSRLNAQGDPTAITALTARMEQLRSQFDPTFVAAQRLTSDLNDLAEAERLGVQIAGGYQKALEEIVVKHDAAAAAAKRQRDEYARLAQEGREALAADRSQATINRTLGVGAGTGLRASDSASVFSEQLGRRDEIDRLRAQQQGAYFTSDLNQRLGVNGFGTSARSSAAAFEEAARSAEELERKVASVRAQIDPLGAAQNKLNAELAEYGALALRGALSSAELAKAQAMAHQRYDAHVSDLQRFQSSSGTNNNTDNMAQFRRQNLTYQIFDIGQTAAMGMNPAMILAQQGPQIVQMYAGQGGVNAAMKDFGAVIAAAARYVAPFAAAGVAAYGVYKILASYTVEASLAVDDLTKALAGQAAPLGSLRGQIDELTGFQKTYNDAIRESAKASTDATATIIANTEREFNARKALLELEEKRQQALLKSQQSEMLIAQQQLKRQLAEQVTTRTDLQAQGFADPRIGSVPFVRLPDSVSGLDKTRDILENSPLADRIKELRANLELTEIGAQQLQEALKKTFETKPYGDGTLPIVGPVPTPRPNIEMEGLPGEAKTDERTRRSYEEVIRSGQERIEQMKLEAQVSGLTGIAAERMRFQLDMLQEAQDKGRKITPDQRREIEKLGDAYEEAARQAARLNLQADAQFDRDQIGRSERDQKIASQLRGAGLPVDMNSYEAGILRANEALRDQLKAWEDIRDIGRDAIDQITGSALNGFDDIDDVLKNIGQNLVKEFAQLSIANPLKNALYGDNNPTMESVGGIGGVFSALLGGRNPAATSTGTMTVTAATVMVNGGLPEALSNPLSGIAGNAANQNGPGLPGTMSQYAQAIKNIESYGGKYDALGPVTAGGDRAYGAYQIMGKNIPEWSKAALGKSVSVEEFMRDPSLQDKIFNHRFGGYVSKYGPTGAAKAWFGGPGAVNGSGNSTDMLGMSVSQYANKFNASLSDMTKQVGAAGQGLDNLGGSFTQFGQDLTKFFPSAPSASGGGAAGGLGITGWLQRGLNWLISPQWRQAASGSITGLFSDGGYTGPGGIYEPRGIVHAGEVVWSQRDVARAGGVAVVDGMRRGLRGYATGGSPDYRPAYYAANANSAAFSNAPSIQIINTSSVPVTGKMEENGTDERGRRQYRMVMSDAVADGLTTPGGKGSRAMRETYGIKRRGIGQ